MGKRERATVVPIKASVATLGELFSDQNQFRLPPFQRAYAWTTEQVSRLLTDLVEASRRTAEMRRHFLGRLLLARAPGSAGISVIDGHQRLMSLTILFAVLRDLDREKVDPVRPGDLVAAASGGAGRYRLEPHAGLAHFMEGYVQSSGATEIPFDGDPVELSETEANIIANRDYLRTQIAEADDPVSLRRALALLLIEDCRVVVVEVEDEIEAWSMLQTEEQTRLDFNATDRAKASILSAMPPEDRGACGRIWETWQARLGSDGMRALLDHVRTLELRKRSDVPVETELIGHFGLQTGAVGFFEARLAPRAEWMTALRGREAWSDADRDAICAVLETVTWVDNPLWVAAAIRWLERYGPRHAGTRAFFSRIECLVWMLRLAGVDPQVQQTRFLKLLDEIDRAGDVRGFRMLDIEARLLAQALAGLRARTLYYKHYCAAVLRRVSVALGEDPLTLVRQASTIEHVLPRNPPVRRMWWQRFGNKERINSNANRLGNLLLLSRDDNQRTAAEDWEAKRETLARSEFLISRQAAAEEEWSPATIERRTEALIAALMSSWGLAVRP